MNATREAGCSAPTKMNLITGDCLREMAHLPTGLVDVVVTSPPYNRNIGYRTYRDDLRREDYLQWSSRWLKEVARILADNGSFFLNVGDSFSDPLFAHEILFKAVESGFRLQNTFHWIKSISIETPDGAVVSRGHFRPIRSRSRVNNCHEYVFHLSKSGRTLIDRKAIGVPYADKSNVKRWKHSGGEDRRCRGNAWFIPYRTIQSRERERPHPATFPVELAERCLRLHGNCGVVLDPFVGLGNSAIAAIRSGARHFIGYDVDEEYIKLAASRVAVVEE